MKVAIPSVGRAARLAEATLPLLLAGGVPAAEITVYVPDEEAAAEYRPITEQAGVGLSWGHGMGVRQARNAIARAYPRGTELVEVDDDITAFQQCQSPKQLTRIPPGQLWPLWRDCFAAVGGHLWCWYPVANPYFMWPGKVRRGGLWYAIATCFGYTVTGDDSELVTVDDKEDFERSIRFYLRDGEVVRFDRYTFQTRYYTEPGGMQLYRTPETIEAGARRVAANYPQLATAYRKRSGRWEVRLRTRPAPTS